MQPGSLLLTTGGLVVAAAITVFLLALLAPYLIRLMDELRAVVRDFVQQAILEPFARLGTVLDGHRARTLASLKPVSDQGSLGVGRMVLLAVWLTACWVLLAYVELDVMRARFLSLLGGDPSSLNQGKLSLFIGLWGVATLAIFVAVLCETVGIGGPSGLFPTARQRRLWMWFSLGGILLTIATSIIIAVASVEAVAGTNDPAMQYLLWGLYVLTTMGALVFSSLVAMHMLQVLVLVALVVLRVAVVLARWLLGALAWLLDGLLRLVLVLLGAPYALRRWYQARRARRRQPAAPVLVPLRVRPPVARRRRPAHKLAAPSPNGKGDAVLADSDHK